MSVQEDYFLDKAGEESVSCKKTHKEPKDAGGWTTHISLCL